MTDELKMPEPLSNAALAAICKRVSAATPGPWDWDEGEEGFEITPRYEACIASPWSDDFPHPGFVPNDGAFTEEQRRRILADEEFSAHARTDVELLLLEIERLRPKAAAWDAHIAELTRVTDIFVKPIGTQRI